MFNTRSLVCLIVSASRGKDQQGQEKKEKKEDLPTERVKMATKLLPQLRLLKSMFDDAKTKSIAFESFGLKFILLWDLKFRLP